MRRSYTPLHLQFSLCLLIPFIFVKAHTSPLHHIQKQNILSLIKQTSFFFSHQYQLTLLPQTRTHFSLHSCWTSAAPVKVADDSEVGFVDCHGCSPLTAVGTHRCKFGHRISPPILNVNHLRARDCRVPHVFNQLRSLH